MTPITADDPSRTRGITAEETRRTRSITAEETRRTIPTTAAGPGVTTPATAAGPGRTTPTTAAGPGRTGRMTAGKPAGRTTADKSAARPAAETGAATRWRVVVLDDDDRSRTALGTAIASAGGRTTAESTRCPGAVEVVQRAGADVAIVAAELPEGDPIAVAAETMSTACCPVVLVGREAPPSLVVRALEAGVMGFLLKPLRRGQLAPTLDLAVARFQEAQRLRRALEDRKVIERAKGRLMDREGLCEEEAYRRLRTAAMNARRTMVDIALDLLAGDAMSGPRPPAPALAESRSPVSPRYTPRPRPRSPRFGLLTTEA